MVYNFAMVYIMVYIKMLTKWADLWHFLSKGERTTTFGITGRTTTERERSPEHWEPKYKDIARERLEQLERLEEIGKINPRGENFKPLEVLEQPENNAIVCNTVQEAFKKFLESKSHLSGYKCWINFFNS